MRTALADGWGGSMISTDITDILFGTPVPLTSEVNMGSLEEDQVNIIIHGHEPLLSELILMACQAPEMIEYAKTKGAKGINLTGICCTANETLMRQGDGLKRWYLSAIDELAQSGIVGVSSIHGLSWCEVDDAIDLAFAETVVRQWPVQPGAQTERAEQPEDRPGLRVWSPE